ncbi:hypothetical protein LEP1GSC133_1962 [Leptospira borgpetersenii serovar Pomona str. 200901868]|uniref:Uncharacterized protein n=1 Tax=Leptospira borgpetersenii serovar Pomona str. 200901868 TaxID=1192866 RepID=M6W3Y6_LEPBO|nr:hypothetical protein LEP1GSC133_1962 [Leptospira borgpetersenii serovar Pomona str. 200901868]
MGDLKNMRKKIYCSGWGAISELVPKPEEKYLSTIRQVFKKRESSHRNRRIAGFPVV